MKRINIAFVDNINHNLFVMARYFKDLNCNVSLYLIPNDTNKHFHPKADTFNTISKYDWIKTFPSDYSPISIINIKKNKIYNEFKDFDYVIACGMSIGLLHASKIKVDIFLPYGADICNLPFLPHYKNLFHFIPRFFYSLIRGNIQSNGIKNCKIILCPPYGVIKNSLKKLKIDNVSCITSRLYMPEYEGIENYNSEQWDFMNDKDFKVFSHTRHLWKTNSEHIYSSPIRDFSKKGGVKRNDILIKAFARIVRKKLFNNPILILFEYGADVLFSKRLIKELNIEKHVKWMPLMEKKYIFFGLKKATFVVDQFRLSSPSAGVTQEGLSFNIPTITNTGGSHEDPNDPHYQVPLLHATNEKEVYNHFYDYYKNPNNHQKIIEQSKVWCEKNLGINLAKKQLNILLNYRN